MWPEIHELMIGLALNQGVIMLNNLEWSCFLSESFWAFLCKRLFRLLIFSDFSFSDLKSGWMLLYLIVIQSLCFIVWLSIYLTVPSWANCPVFLTIASVRQWGRPQVLQAGPDRREAGPVRPVVMDRTRQEREPWTHLEIKCHLLMWEYGAPKVHPLLWLMMPSGLKGVLSNDLKLL